MSIYLKDQLMLKKSTKYITGVEGDPKSGQIEYLKTKKKIIFLLNLYTCKISAVDDVKSRHRVLRVEHLVESKNSQESSVQHEEVEAEGNTFSATVNL